MSVEVRNLVIKGSVGTAPEARVGSSSGKASGLTDEDRRAIIEECMDNLAQLLKEKLER